MATSLQQAAALFKTLSDFFKAESSSAGSVVGSPNPPNFRDYVSAIDFSELLRISLNEQGGNPSFINGASVDTIHHASAVLREYNMCNMNKNYYTVVRSATADTESTFFTNKGILVDAQLKGTSR